MLLSSSPVVFHCLWSHGLQHASPPCPSASPGVCPSSHSLHRWCHPAVSSSDALDYTPRPNKKFQVWKKIMLMNLYVKRETLLRLFLHHGILRLDGRKMRVETLPSWSLFPDPILLASISQSEVCPCTTQNNRSLNWLLIVYDKIRSSSQSQCSASSIVKVLLWEIKVSAELHSGLMARMSHMRVQALYPVVDRHWANDHILSRLLKRTVIPWIEKRVFHGQIGLVVNNAHMISSSTWIYSYIKRLEKLQSK